MSSSLGRGLQSLIPQKESITSSRGTFNLSKNHKESVFNIEVDKIRPNASQPRKEISDGKLQELADSIREHGILQPLVVTKVEKETDRGRDVEYELVAGERRWRASKLAGLPRVPVIIRDASAKEKLQLALIENIQREDLNAIDLALALKQLQDEFRFKQTEIARKLGKSRVTITNSLRLLKLPPKIQQAVINGVITEGHGRAILMAEPKARMAVFQRVVDKGLGVRAAEDEARKVASNENPKVKGPKNPFFKKLENDLETIMGQHVSITQRGEKGHLRIEFATRDELNAVVNCLRSFNTE